MQGAYDMAVFGICQFFGRYFGNLNKNGRYLVFQSPNGDGKIHFWIGNSTVTTFTQKIDHDVRVIFEKNYSNSKPCTPLMWSTAIKKLKYLYTLSNQHCV